MAISNKVATKGNVGAHLLGSWEVHIPHGNAFDFAFHIRIDKIVCNSQYGMAVYILSYETHMPIESAQDL